MKKNNLVLIASIGKPRGLKGEFFLNSYSNPAENILNYSNFLKNDDISVNLKIEYIRRINKKFYSKILDINDVDEIKKYTNTKIIKPLIGLLMMALLKIAKIINKGITNDFGI